MPVSDAVVLLVAGATNVHAPVPRLKPGSATRPVHAHPLASRVYPAAQAHDPSSHTSCGPEHCASQASATSSGPSPVVASDEKPCTPINALHAVDKHAASRTQRMNHPTATPHA